MRGIRAHKIHSTELFITFLYVRMQQNVFSLEEGLHLTILAPYLGLLAPELWAINFCCLWYFVIAAQTDTPDLMSPNSNLWELGTLMSSDWKHFLYYNTCPCKTLILQKRIFSLKIQKTAGYFLFWITQKLLMSVSESYLFVQDTFPICVS